MATRDPAELRSDVAAPAATGSRGGDASGAILRIDGLTVRFGGLTALNNVNFSVPRGEIRAVIGPNGAGKSTFFNCLTGVLRPTEGRILFGGSDIAGLPPNRISLLGIANTLALSINERRRELGLLRAVGMHRRQLRQSVRSEALMISLLGALLGAGLAVIGAWGLVTAMASERQIDLVVPVVRMVAIVGVAAVAGVLAARGPARRASRLDVLEALTNA